MSVAEAPQQIQWRNGGEKIFGMENFGNTCYSNSILQCLYYSDSFRNAILRHNDVPRDPRKETRGDKAHSFTAKYEQIMSKKAKELRPDRTSAPASSNGNTLDEKPRMPRRNLLFGRKHILLSTIAKGEALNGSDEKAVASFLVSVAQCQLVPPEQKQRLKGNKGLNSLPVMVTRPLISIGQSPSLVETSNNAQNSAVLITDTLLDKIAEGSILRLLSVIVVGVPQTDSLNQANPFSLHPSTDYRKRLALIKGPIINVDCRLPKTRNGETLPDNAPENSLLYALQDIFHAMAENESPTGVLLPSYFIETLKAQNFIFRQNNMHHDAHEFFNYLINDIIDALNREKCARNWCTDIFQGKLTNETRCLMCETVTSRQENFLDLSVDIPLHGSSYSLSHTLDNFSRLELLNHQNKFYCNTCASLQEAEKSSKICELPQILVVNFKRFKYDEGLDKMVKLFDSVSYPRRLRLLNISGELDVPDIYSLYAMIVHVGGGPTHGHYVLMCKLKVGIWLLFDDETVEVVDDAYVMRFFGDGPGLASTYILFYERQKGNCIIEESGILSETVLGYDINVFNGEDCLDSLHVPHNEVEDHPEEILPSSTSLPPGASCDNPSLNSKSDGDCASREATGISTDTIKTKKSWFGRIRASETVPITNDDTSLADSLKTAGTGGKTLDSDKRKEKIVTNDRASSGAVKRKFFGLLRR